VVVIFLLEKSPQEDAMVQMKRPDLSQEEWNKLRDAAVGKPDQRARKKDGNDRLATEISVEEHLAGLWKVLGLGD
jgi:hypothetical protein